VQNFTPVGPRISEISRVKKTSALKHKPAPQAIAFGRTNKLTCKRAYMYTHYCSNMQRTLFSHTPYGLHLLQFFLTVRKILSS